jgi:hypothetical protein
MVEELALQQEMVDVALRGSGEGRRDRTALEVCSEPLALGVGLVTRRGEGTRESTKVGCASVHALPATREQTARRFIDH